MTNTIMNTTPELTTVILRGIEDRLKRINPEDLNAEGTEALRCVKIALDDLVEVVAYYELVAVLEERELMRGHRASQSGGGRKTLSFFLQLVLKLCTLEVSGGV